MSNRWKAALAWIASMSVVWTLFVPRGVSLVELLAVSIMGVVVFLHGIENEPRTVAARLSKAR